MAEAAAATEAARTDFFISGVVKGELKNLDGSNGKMWSLERERNLALGLFRAVLTAYK